MLHPSLARDSWLAPTGRMTGRSLIEPADVVTTPAVHPRPCRFKPLVWALLGAGPGVPLLRISLGPMLIAILSWVWIGTGVLADRQCLWQVERAMAWAVWPAAVAHVQQRPAALKDTLIGISWTCSQFFSRSGRACSVRAGLR